LLFWTTFGVVTVLSVPFFIGERIGDLRLEGNQEVLAPDLPDGTAQERMSVLYRRVADRIASLDGPVVLIAGDCLAPIGVLAGLQRREIQPTLIWFDAHGDFHTWETTSSGFLGGMPLAMIVGRGEQTIVHQTGLTPLEEGRVVLVDARDLDPGEAEAVLESNVTLTPVSGVAHSLPPDGPLFVHVDVDVVDPTEMPAVDYPAPEGPSLAEVRAALLHLVSTERVVAFSVSAWNPELPGAGRAAEATSRLAALFTS
jgi:arginase